MEELFENKTKYTQKAYDIFIDSYMQEYSLSNKLFMLWNFSFFGFCAVLAFYSKEIMLGIAIIIGLLIYLAFIVVKPILEGKKVQKSEKLSGTFINTYKFYKKYFRAENPDGEAQIYYFKLYKIVETEEYFYLYISRDYAFIMAKSGFTKGTIEEFTNFMRKKIYLKYKDRTINTKIRERFAKK